MGASETAGGSSSLVARLWRLLSGRHAHKIVAGCTVAVLAFGVAASAKLGDDIRFYDEREYLALGENVADHGSYSFNGEDPTAYRAPGYPLVIAAVRVLGLELPVVRFVNFLFVALTVLAVYALTREFAGRGAGVLAALVAAAYPLFLFTATTFYPQTLATLLLMMMLLALQRALGADGRRRTALGAAAGVSAGALAMVVPTLAFVVPVALIWLLLVRRRDVLRIGVPLLACALVLPGAWTIRNAFAMDDFVPLTTGSGFNLLIGNHPGASASEGYRAEEIGPYQREARRRGLDEIEADEYYGEEARRWISDNPGRAAALYLGKVVNNFAPTNRLETRAETSKLRDAVASVSYIPLLLLLVIRLALVRRHPLRPIESLIVALIVGNALLLAVYTTRVRYRLPLDLPMIAMVAGFVAALISRAALRQHATPAR